MRRKGKRRQHWLEPYKRTLIEVLIILVIWKVVQGDPHTISSLIRLIGKI